MEFLTQQAKPDREAMAPMVDEPVRELTEALLATVGGGIGDVVFG